MPTDQEDNENFIAETIKKTNEDLFKSDFYSDFIPFHKRPKLPKNPGCGCVLKNYQQEQEQKSQQN